MALQEERLLKEYGILGKVNGQSKGRDTGPGKPRAHTYVHGVGAHVCGYPCIHVHVCVKSRSQLWASCIGCHPLCSLKQGHFIGIALVSLLGWLSSKPQESARLLLPVLGLRAGTTTPCFLHAFWGIRLRPSCRGGKHLVIQVTCPALFS